MARVLVSDPLSKEGLKILEEADGIQVDVKTGLEKDELCKIIPSYDALVVRSQTKVTEEVIRAGERLRVIGRAGVGVDNIDLDEATKRGIIVMNAPGGNTVSTAEHTMAMILALSRNIPQAVSSLKMGEWERKKFRGVELFSKRLGIVGLGRIGSYVAKLAKAFGMKVLAYDPYISLDKAKRIGVELVEIEDLYRSSDYITFHIPLTDKTYHMVGENEFKKMKDGVRIINCARGGIIDEDALYRAMEDGKVGGAAFDVYENEPPVESPLLKLPNFIGVPHIGASTIEAQINVGIEMAHQIVDALRDGPIRNAVNIHQVEPEVLDEIGPYLALSEKIGKLHAQLLEGHMEEVEMKIGGEISMYEVAPFKAAFLKGLLGEILEGAVVNYVNAPYIAKERGLEVVEVKDKEEKDFVNLVTISLRTDRTTRSIAGSIFAKEDLRIVSIDGFRIDGIPSGNMLIISNVDRPGVIGKIGTILGNEGINIGGLQMGRKAIGGRQLIVLNIDHEIKPETIQRIQREEEILDVRVVRL
jgi:D-3-phosphoglycerate dehydrogenase